MVQRNSIKISSRIDKLINNGGVKLHKFLPSNREIWTVIGSLGDQIIFINNNYCTCKALYFSIVIPCTLSKLTFFTNNDFKPPS